MRLADFIDSNIEPILMAWESFARGTAPGAKMDTLALRDHAPEILLATVQDMRSSEGPTQSSAHSNGNGDHGKDGAALQGASELHAVGRLGSGFDLLQLVSEYRALRASVLGLWRKSLPADDHHDVDDLSLFHESIDQSLAKAVSTYTKRVEESRDMFLAILSHDLRNPLSCISMSAQLLPLLGKLGPESVEFASKISNSARVMGRMISDLLDYTRTRLGAGMPVSRVPMDLGAVCREVVDEFQSSDPDLQLKFASTGDATGEWDAARLRQVVSNLLGNAIQHGDRSSPIELTLKGEDSGVMVAICNQGSPIPQGELAKIFDPLVRGASAETQKQNRPGSIGLGLYIARELVTAHGGTIDVKSSAQAGTVFTIHIPKTARADLPQIHPGASLAATEPAVR